MAAGSAASTDQGRLHQTVRLELEILDVPVTERRMFGGITFMHQGNMLCCVARQGLMVRVGADQEAVALAMPSALPCMGTGRRMAGFVMVDHEALHEPASVERWLKMALKYVAALPAKDSSSPQSSKRSGRK